MRPQEDLLSARRKLRAARASLVKRVVDAMASANDDQLAKVAAVFWPEPKKEVEPKKQPKGAARKRVHPVQTVTPESAKNAAAGRVEVARGDRPPLRKAIVVVMGKRTMNATMIVEALKDKRWSPASTDPRQYVSYMLSSNTPGTFERTAKRGFYRVIGPNSKVTAERVWAVIQSRALKGFTLVELAKWVGCRANQLNSIVFKLQQEHKLTRDGTKRPFVYERVQKLPFVYERVQKLPRSLKGSDVAADAKLKTMFDIDDDLHANVDVASDPHAEAVGKGREALPS